MDKEVQKNENKEFRSFFKNPSKFSSFFKNINIVNKFKNLFNSKVEQPSSSQTTGEFSQKHVTQCFVVATSISSLRESSAESEEFIQSIDLNPTYRAFRSTLRPHISDSSILKVIDFESSDCREDAENKLKYPKGDPFPVFKPLRCNQEQKPITVSEDEIINIGEKLKYENFMSISRKEKTPKEKLNLLKEKENKMYEIPIKIHKQPENEVEIISTSKEEEEVESTPSLNKREIIIEGSSNAIKISFYDEKPVKLANKRRVDKLSLSKIEPKKSVSAPKLPKETIIKRPTKDPESYEFIKNGSVDDIVRINLENSNKLETDEIKGSVQGPPLGEPKSPDESTISKPKLSSKLFKGVIVKKPNKDVWIKKSKGEKVEESNEKNRKEEMQFLKQVILNLIKFKKSNHSTEVKESEKVKIIETDKKIISKHVAPNKLCLEELNNILKKKKATYKIKVKNCKKCKAKHLKLEEEKKKQKEKKVFQGNEFRCIEEKEEMVVALGVSDVKILKEDEKSICQLLSLRYENVPKLNDDSSETLLNNWDFSTVTDGEESEKEGIKPSKLKITKGPHIRSDRRLIYPKSNEKNCITTTNYGNRKCKTPCILPSDIKSVASEIGYIKYMENRLRKHFYNLKQTDYQLIFKLCFYPNSQGTQTDFSDFNVEKAFLQARNFKNNILLCRNESHAQPNVEIIYKNSKYETYDPVVMSKENPCDKLVGNGTDFNILYHHVNIQAIKAFVFLCASQTNISTSAKNLKTVNRNLFLKLV